MRNFLRGILLVGAMTLTVTAVAQLPGLVPKIVELDTHGHDYLAVLSGPPETAGMRSGLVVLTPQKSVGRHSTGQNEEVLIVLEGRGEMLFGDGHRLTVEAKHAVYCPPRTVHDVKNTGRSVLRYVYVVANLR
jgi:mannose-6-phosphate isomerase-like protein (cupin superfamily)